MFFIYRTSNQGTILNFIDTKNIHYLSQDLPVMSQTTVAGSLFMKQLLLDKLAV